MVLEMGGSLIRNTIRAFAYSTPLHRILGMGQAKFDQEYWNKQLSGAFKPHLGGTISVGVRNSIVLSLIDNVIPHARRLLDVGCASGSLFRAHGGHRFSYVGTGISDVAIEEAQKLSPDAEFHTARLEDFSPERVFDVIVLNEVLYYLAVKDARKAAEKYSRYLTEKGILIVSMKEDPKSRAIFSEIGKALQWVNGILYQEKATAGPEFSIRRDAKRPAYMIGVFTRCP